MMLSNFPESIVVTVLCEWLVVDDIYAVDLACTNQTERSPFLLTLQNAGNMINVSQYCSKFYRAHLRDSPTYCTHSYDVNDGHSYLSLSPSYQLHCPFNVFHWMYCRQIHQNINICLPFDNDLFKKFPSIYVNQGFQFPQICRLRLVLDEFFVDWLHLRSNFSQIQKTFPKAKVQIVIVGFSVKICEELIHLYNVLPCWQMWMDSVYMCTHYFYKRNWFQNGIEHPLFVEFLRLYGETLRSLQTQGNIRGEICPLLAHYCSNLISLHYAPSQPELVASWSYLQRLTELRELDYPAFNLGANDIVDPDSFIAFQDVARAFPMLECVHIHDRSIDCTYNHTEIIAAVFQHCNRIRHVKANHWFEWRLGGGCI
ncbi:hypothetical protein EON65_49825, partial [archaeon]